MSQSIRDRVSAFAFGAVFGLLLAAAGWAWHSLKPSLPAVLGETPNKVVNLPTETKSCTTVQAKAPKAKKALGLPAAVQQDEQASVLAAATVPRTDVPLIASALLHRDTGLGEIYFTPQPRPWLAFDRRWLLGGFYGIRDGQAEPVGELFGLYDLAQIKAVHFGPMGHLDTAGRRFLGVGFWASGR